MYSPGVKCGGLWTFTTEFISLQPPKPPLPSSLKSGSCFQAAMDPRYANLGSWKHRLV